MSAHSIYIAQNVTVKNLVTYVSFLNVIVFFSVKSKMARKCLYFTIERQTNTIKQPQNEQMASRVGNFFRKRWQPISCFCGDL